MIRFSNIKTILVTAAVTAVITAALFLGINRTTGNPTGEGAVSQAAASEAAGERKIIYWRAPMDPMEIYDEPGKSKMGMDLVPVYEDEVSGDTASKDRKIVYWKAPMDPTEIYEQPGRSKMGMDLVPVYEDELVGGVDIKIDPVVQQNMGLKIATAQKKPIIHTIKTYGHVTYDERRTGIVSQKTAGWIEKLYADYTGLYVDKGQPLYEIYSPALLASQEELVSASKNYKKNPGSFNKELLESARNRLSYFDIAPEEIAGIEKSGQVKKTVTVRSPFSGIITHKNVVEGAYAKPGAPLFTISDLSHVWVEAHIFEYEQGLVSVGQEVEMTLSYTPEKIFKGKVSYITPYLQTKTRDVIIRIDFENEDSALKPDMFANIRIKTDTDRQGVSIPSEAVIHTGEKKIVFVASGSGTFTPREVKTGIYMEDGTVEVLTGIVQGDTVVVSGQFLLDSESKLKEAIQKMIQSKSGSPSEEAQKDEDAFFDDMEAEDGNDDFFSDME